MNLVPISVSELNQSHVGSQVELRFKIFDDTTDIWSGKLTMVTAFLEPVYDDLLYANIDSHMLWHIHVRGSENGESRYYWLECDEHGICFVRSNKGPINCLRDAEDAVFFNRIEILVPAPHLAHSIETEISV